MAKAKIETDNGTKITIEGDVAEVTAIVNAVKGGYKQGQEQRGPTPTRRNRENKAATSLVDLILQLKDENFFNKPRRISEVKAELDKKAHIYPIPSISTALIRRVKHGDLGRVQNGSLWAYVKR